jgi:hypothetical protein
MRDLIRHFFDRFFDKEALSPQGEPEANVTQTLGLLAVPGAFIVLLLQMKSFRRWDLAEIRCFMLAFSMIVTGFLVVFEWDALFPDRRDYQVLTPLPIGLFAMFAAKAVSFGIFLGIFLADVNFLSTFLWPSIDSGNSALAIYGAHLAAVFLSGLFAATSMAALQGVLITILPAAAFRRVSASVQTALMGLLVMLLFLSPALATFLQSLIRHRSPWVYAYPPYWFAGFYERLRPAVHDAALLQLGNLALWALAASIALFALTYLPGYRRHARKIIEAPQPSPSGPPRWKQAIAGWIDRRILRRPVQIAVFHFMNQTVTRSMKHRLFLATYAGCGGALAVFSFASNRHGPLALPLTLSFILISALRAAFHFPSELAANWAFQVSESRHVSDCLAATRKWIVVCAIAPLLALQSVMEFAFFAWPTALFHLAFGAALAVLLMEIMFFGFRQTPFTCSYFPGKVNLVFLTVIYILGFSIYSVTMASLEAWLTANPVAAAGFLTAAAALTALLTWWRHRRLSAESQLAYHDSGDPVIRTLELSA